MNCDKVMEGNGRGLLRTGWVRKGGRGGGDIKTFLRGSAFSRFIGCEVAEKCKGFYFYSFSPLSITVFSPVILSLSHSLPPSVSSSFAFVLKSLCPLLRLLPPPLSVYTVCVLSPSLPSREGSQVSAVTALVQGIMICNSLRAPL